MSKKRLGGLVPNSRLDSWKAIASYLGRGLRTVQRWHVEYGMPVHHFGGTKGCVFAYSEELDRWLLESGDTSGARDGGEHPAVEARKTRSREVSTHADAMWESRSERNLASITALYREAVDEDPGNYPALIGLSRSLTASALLDVADGFVAYPSAIEALRRVPRGGSGETEAECAAAWLKMVYERRWREARSDFDDVLRKKPSDSYALAGRALLYVTEGRLPEAFSCAWEAWSMNPLASPLNFLPAWIEYLNGDCEGALELLEGAKASGEYGVMNAVVEALALAQSMPVAANLARIEELAAAYPQSRVLEGVLGYSYAAAGHPGKVWEMLGSLMQLSERKKKSSSYMLALILLGLDEKQEACMYLERSFAEGSLWSLGFRTDPLLRPLRGDSRFDSLLRRIGPAPNGRNTTAGVAPGGLSVRIAEGDASYLAGAGGVEEQSGSLVAAILAETRAIQQEWITGSGEGDKHRRTEASPAPARNFGLYTPGVQLSKSS